MPAQVKKPQI